MESHLRQGKAVSRPSSFGHDGPGFDVHTARTDVQPKPLLSFDGKQYADVVESIDQVSPLANHAPLKQGDVAHDFPCDELRKGGSRAFVRRPPLE